MTLTNLVLTAACVVSIAAGQILFLFHGSRRCGKIARKGRPAPHKTTNDFRGESFHEPEKTRHFRGPDVPVRRRRRLGRWVRSHIGIRGNVGKWVSLGVVNTNVTSRTGVSDYGVTLSASVRF